MNQTTTDPAERLRIWSQYAPSGQAVTAFLEDVDQALAAAYQRGQTDERERIRAAVQAGTEGAHIHQAVLAAILDAQADREWPDNIPDFGDDPVREWGEGNEADHIPNVGDERKAQP